MDDTNILTETQQKELFNSLDMLKYIISLFTIFYFLKFKNISLFIIIIWIIIHITSHKYFYSFFISITKSLEQSELSQFHSIIIQIIFIAILILRTIGAILYSYGYTKMQMIFNDKGEEYEISRHYRNVETEYKKLYMIGTCIIVALLLFFSNFPKDIFNSLNINFSDNFFTSIGYLLGIFAILFISYLSIENFNSKTKLDKLIYTSYIFLLITIIIIFVRQLINYLKESVFECKLFENNNDNTVNGFFNFLTQFSAIYLTSVLGVLSAFEFNYAIIYQKLHNKY